MTRKLGDDGKATGPTHLVGKLADSVVVPPSNPERNRLYYGDNLDVLRQHVADESVDLIYLDPPFNSDRSYNVLFREKSGEEAQAQIEAFDDTWTWSQESEALFQELMQSGGAPLRVQDAMAAMRRLLGDNDVLAYLVMMTIRLVELRRVLKPTGSLYLHCDPTASHYLKVVLDAVFGPKCFRNEIIWRRTGAHGKVRRFAPVHDVIFFYTKTEDNNFRWRGFKRPYMRRHVEQYFVQDEKGWRTNYYGNVLTGSGIRGGESGKPWRGFDPTAKGRHWAIPGAIVEECGEDFSDLSQHEKLDRLYELGFIKIEPDAAWPIYEHYLSPNDGVSVSDIWAFQPYTDGTVFGTNEGIDEDVRWLSPRDGERLRFQTQKPVGLLERIITASSDREDVVLDPFAGCGTTIDAAQKLGRRWIGIDITTIAVDLIDARLRHSYGEQIKSTYEIVGIPRDLAGAQALFDKSPFEFERWCVMMLDGQPNEKQVGDRGIDGVIRIATDNRGGSVRVLLSVKGGATGPSHVRDLVGAVESQSAAMGILISLREPTRGMHDAANHSGLYTYPITNKRYPRVQLITVAELLSGKHPDLPANTLLPYFEAKRRQKTPDQYVLGL